MISLLKHKLLLNLKYFTSHTVFMLVYSHKTGTSHALTQQYTSLNHVYRQILFILDQTLVHTFTAAGSVDYKCISYLKLP